MPASSTPLPLRPLLLSSGASPHSPSAPSPAYETPWDLEANYHFHPCHDFDFTLTHTLTSRMCHQSPPSAPSVTAHTSSTASDSIIVPHYSKQQEVPKERESSIGALPSSHVDSLSVPSAQIWEEFYGQLKDPEAGDKTTDVPSLTPAAFSVSQSVLQPGGSLFDFSTLVTLVPCSNQLTKDLVDLPIPITEGQFTGTELLNRSDNVNFPQQDWLANAALPRER